jgi:hypothetical protein
VTGWTNNHTQTFKLSFIFYFIWVWSKLQGKYSPKDYGEDNFPSYSYPALDDFFRVDVLY